MNNLPKKQTIFNKIINKLRNIMGYTCTPTKFIDETLPYIHEYSFIETNQIANIEYKLKKALKNNTNEEKTIDGISMEEANQLLEWVIQRTREILQKNNQIDINSDDLMGCCGLSQGVVFSLLNKMGLSSRVSNLNPTITGSSLGGHAFNSVSIPIVDTNSCKEKDFLIDATYRQFFLRDTFSVNGRFIKDKKFGGKASPMAGYFCLKLPNGKEFAHTMLRKGFIELTPKTAKIYGDSFILSQEENKKYKELYEEGTTVPVPREKNLITGISGETYFKNFIDPSMQDLRGIDFNKNDLENYYGTLMNTPLMTRELQNSKNSSITEILYPNSNIEFPFEK